MPRIRSIKPELCTSTKVAGLSERAQLLWPRLWLFCDDEGRMEYDPRLIKSNCFPLIDKVTPNTCEGLISELSTAGLIIIYEACGKLLLQVTNWDDNQRINRPQKSKLPPLPAETLNSVNVHGTITDDSLLERKGKERKGKDKEIGADENGKRFVPPTKDEVISYCNEQGHSISADRFIAFYESKGWMVGKNKMKDWKAAVRGWAIKDAPEPKKESKFAKYDRIDELVVNGVTVSAK